MNRKFLCFVLAAAFALGAFEAKALLIWLKDGSLIHGEVVEYSETSVLIRRLDNEGVVEIPWKNLDPISANRLKEKLGTELSRRGRKLFTPDIRLCTDNAAMIAAAGYYQYETEGASEFIANAVPNLPLVQD